MAQATKTLGLDYNSASFEADRRSFHTLFDTHVILNDDGSYTLYDEQDWNATPAHMIDRICYSATGQLAMIE